MKLKQILCAALLAALLLAVPGAAQAAPVAAPLFEDTVIFGENFTLFAGETTDNLIVFGGNVTVEQGATVRQSLVVFGGNANLHGDVGETVLVFGGNVNLNGHVGESAVVVGGNMDLGDSAIVEEDLLAFAGNVSRAPGALVRGNQASDPRPLRFEEWIAPERDGRIALQAIRGFQILGMLAAALVLVLLVPRHLANTADTIARNGVVAGGLGLLTYVLLPLALILTLITLILPPIILLLVIAGSIFGWVALGLELGRRIEDFLKVSWTLEVQALIGTLVLGTVSMVFRGVPCIGWLGMLALCSVGLGATLLSRFGAEAPAEPVAALPAPRPARKPAAKSATAKPAAARSAAAKQKSPAAKRPRKPKPPAEG